jgi:hypothetical protein
MTRKFIPQLRLVYENVRGRKRGKEKNGRKKDEKKEGVGRKGVKGRERQLVKIIC